MASSLSVELLMRNKVSCLRLELQRLQLPQALIFSHSPCTRATGFPSFKFRLRVNGFWITKEKLEARMEFYRLMTTVFRPKVKARLVETKQFWRFFRVMVTD
jgi:hypothetical protein